MPYSVTLVFILNLVLRAVCCAKSRENLVTLNKFSYDYELAYLCGPHNYILAVVSGSRYFFLKNNALIFP